MAQNVKIKVKSLSQSNRANENEFNSQNNIDSDVKNNTQKSTLNIGTKYAEEPINFILKSSTKLKEDIDFDDSGAKDFNKSIQTAKN